MKKKILISLILATSLLASACGTAAPATGNTETKVESAQPEAQTAAPAEEPSKEPAKESTPEAKAPALSGSDDLSARPVLINAQDIYSEKLDFTPSVPAYTVPKDFKGVINAEDFSSISDEAKEKLAKYGFAIDISSGEGQEFYEVYEYNRYGQTPNFVTTDSMLHTYHLYFSYLMKHIEKDKLFTIISDLSERMLTESESQYEALKGTEWEEAAKRNVAFFAVASSLIGNGAEVPAYVSDTVSDEISKINSADFIGDSGITGTYEDYSQYKPRGYYDTDENLKKYFRTMMWYGRTAFMRNKEDLDRSALLMTLAMKEDSIKEWKAVYAVTSFFAGESDDPGFCEYQALINQAYGGIPEISALPGNDKAFKDFHSITGKLDPPAINSVVFDDDEGATDKNEESKGFRFMGQRFSLDAAIFQQLIYSKTKENKAGDKRMLPDVLDIPAAFGSDTALDILDSQGDTGYKNYPENMAKMKSEVKNLPDAFWTKSLYSGWLNMLRPFTEPKGNGYPMFMQNQAWVVKSIETFCGSYTELKHDTVLYSKQVMAEMGGGPEDPVDDRGYVEPEPVVFSRLEALVRATAEGLDSFQLLQDNDKKNLKSLEELAGKLKTISIKELENETLTDDEYELILTYGGSLEHFWTEAMQDEKGDKDYVWPEEYPAALVVDIATDPNGEVLEAGTGNPVGILVVVPVEGILRIARGSVYDFYEFHQPLSERLTDDEWRTGMGFSWNFDEEPEKLNVERPSWKSDARVKFYNFD